MSVYRLIHKPSGQVVATVQKADGLWAKGWGVLGRRGLPPGEGVWLPGVASVHTAFVRFPLDLLFLDGQYRAVRLAPQTQPYRWLIQARGACHTLELGAGTLAQSAQRMKVGEEWILEGTSKRRFP